MERLHRNLAGTILVLSIVGYPLVAPISLFIGIESRAVSIPFRGFVLTLSVVVILSRLIAHRKPSKDVFWLVWWTFWGLYVSRIGIDALFNPTALRLSATEYLAYSLGMCVLPAIAIRYRWDEESLARVAWWILVLGFIGVVGNLWLITSSGDAGGIAALAAVRRGTETLNPIGLSHLGVSIAILACFGIVIGRSPGLIATTGLYAALVIGVVAAFVGASRGALLALILILPFTLVTGGKTIGRRRGFRLLVFVAALAGIFMIVMSQGDSLAALARIRNAMEGHSESVAIRLALLNEALEAALQSPLLGKGIEPLGFYPHNLILESFLVFGVWTGLLFSGLIAAGAYRAIINFRTRHLAAWASLLFFQYLIGSMLSGSLYSSYSLWTLLALISTLTSRGQRGTLPVGVGSSGRAVVANSTCSPVGSADRDRRRMHRVQSGVAPSVD